MPGLPFRIMGGGSEKARRNQASNLTAGTSASSQQQPQSRSTTSRYTYPGNRAPAHPPINNSSQAATRSLSLQQTPNNNNTNSTPSTLSLPGMPPRIGYANGGSIDHTPGGSFIQQQQQQSQHSTISHHNHSLSTLLCCQLHRHLPIFKNLASW
jgi:hypothetical protein